jgi:uncharacterized phage-associated protein
MNFDERKTAQLAAYFLQKNKGTLYLIKLIKLLYIADRESFRAFGRPITNDKFVSMDNGPVLSRTYNLMLGATQSAGYWDSMISDRSDHKLSITDPSEISSDALSQAEKAIADRVFDEYGNIPRFKLCDMTHEFPEWEDPHGSSLPIHYERILESLKYSPEEIKHAMVILHEQQALDEFFGAA